MYLIGRGGGVTSCKERHNMGTEIEAEFSVLLIGLAPPPFLTIQKYFNAGRNFRFFLNLETQFFEGIRFFFTGDSNIRKKLNKKKCIPQTKWDICNPHMQCSCPICNGLKEKKRGFIGSDLNFWEAESVG